MRPIKRIPLTTEAAKALDDRASKVRRAKNRARKVATLWRAKGSALDEVRRTLRRMCSGIERCMYCEDSVGTDIEHFWPKSRYPLRAFAWLNYLLACTVCNSNYKRVAFRMRRRRPLLVDPTAEDPLLHMTLDPLTGEFLALDERGVESIRTFGLWRQTLVEGRRNAWVSFEALLVKYGRHRDRSQKADAQRTELALRESPFSSLLWHLVALAAREDARELVDSPALDVLERYPEIKSWCEG